MSRFWTEKVRQIQPYVPGEQPSIDKLIKLNTNENPFPPSPDVVAAMQAACSNRMNLYPDSQCVELKKTLASTYNVKPDQVFVGNGSDEVLAHAFAAFFQSRTRAPLLFADMTYGFYPVYAQLFDVEYQTIPLDANYGIQIQDYKKPNRGIIIANPNAPTGCLLSLDELIALLKMNANSLVIVDEAYIDFGGESAIKLINDYDNLLVVQTFSKSRSLAGLRVGMAFGQAPLIEGLERIKNSFNPYPLSREAQAGAAASLLDKATFNKHRKAIIQARQYLHEQFTELGFYVTPSQANFIFSEHPHHNAADLATYLRQKGILVRHLTSHPRTQNRLRITVGTLPECQALVAAIKTICC